MSGWAAKQAKKAEWAEARKLDGLDNKETTVNDTRDAAMGKGEDQLFEKKLSKEEQKAEKERKKAEAKAKRDAKKAAKGKPLSKKKSKENLEKLAQQEAEHAASLAKQAEEAERAREDASSVAAKLHQQVDEAELVAAIEEAISQQRQEALHDEWAALWQDTRRRVLCAWRASSNDSPHSTRSR